ncbi:DNA polymerase Y family protein [Nocardioides sp. TRM66260-LWL]|uniref:DNA polymerase Y family protein n=1 Tax=Nocardioides sp. TRM66260-LWL TaxID=2874478 RepID=UPI001CC6C7AA|nr:DNA polymerase Y family protein [Nocardioides sp. TRM66260-LWL]MBZ5735869.1 DNA polymerase Y family protein [Nocardioides sp. TRM66260-LWL]
MRVFVVWCPDWPVVAALWEAAGEPSVDGAEAGSADSPSRRPAAVFAANRVVACTATARELGVRRGMRRRDAQGRCPELRVLADAPDRDARAFEPVLAVLEELRPGVALLRPGLAALRSPGRYYGDEEATAAVVAERLVRAGVWDVRIGVADDLFTAEQAARLARPQECRVVPPGGARELLAELPVEVLDDADAVSLLRRLGIESLGQLAALPAPDVRARFGLAVARVHQVLDGVDAQRFAPRTPPPDLGAEVAFEPALDSAEAICFSARRTVERLVAGLTERRLVCTELCVEVRTEGEPPVLARTWLHPRWFSAADVLDRLRYQLAGQGAGQGVGLGTLGAAVTGVRFEPLTVVPEHVHAEGLWGGTDARVERGLARLQGMLGHDRVLQPVLQGGRTPAERQALVPWGQRPTGLRPVEPAWPGRILGPAPARVFPTPWPARVEDASGRPVLVDERGALSGEPVRLHVEDRWQPVVGWAGPWPAETAWWEPGAAQRGPVMRFQLVGADGRAWLITCLDGAWEAVAGYE